HLSQSATAPTKKSAAGTKVPLSVMAVTPSKYTPPPQKGRTRVAKPKGQRMGSVEAPPRPGGKVTSHMSKAKRARHKRVHPLHYHQRKPRIPLHHQRKPRSPLHQQRARSPLHQQRQPRSSLH
ncbi:hypothetical protein NDU88_004891, partial [Pleurodeles waltl]